MVRFYKKLVCIFIFGFSKTVECKSSSSFILEHVKDSYEWHILSTKERDIVIFLPVILYTQDCGIEIFSSKNISHGKGPYKGFFINQNGRLVHEDENLKFLDFSITKNVFYMMLGLLFMIVFFLFGASKMSLTRFRANKGIWAMVEVLIIFIRDKVAIPNIGHKHYRRYMPYILTVFFFIWINNLFGLLPGAANVTGNISVTMSLALVTLLVTLFSAKKNYWRHIFKTPGVPLWLLPIMIPIEVVGIFIKPISLMVRLFANITAGHIILLSIISLNFIFKSIYVGGVSVPFGAFMLLLKLLVAFLQAYVFTLLSCIYIGAAVDGEEH